MQGDHLPLTERQPLTLILINSGKYSAKQFGLKCHFLILSAQLSFDKVLFHAGADKIYYYACQLYK